MLSAVFVGDGVNPAATSVAATVDVGAATVTATANTETIEYGQAIPVLTGSLTGVLPQDSGDVTAVFTATAEALSPPGIYPISADAHGVPRVTTILLPLARIRVRYRSTKRRV